jgi:phosphate:Na+ symporter
MLDDNYVAANMWTHSLGRPIYSLLQAFEDAQPEGDPTNITLTLLDLAGTVALLLWGVHMVQTGIQRAFGARLRSFLAQRLGNRVSAFLAGLGVTALLQSSTATGLMVTGFTAEGLVGLVPALAVMLGANVGTTLIVQFLAFDVSRVAPIFVLGGYLLFRRARAGMRDFGRVLIGLGLILFALHQFLTLLDPVTSNPLTREFLDALSSHIVFIMLLGAVLSWAAHSSVAIVLLAMSLATNGALTVAGGIALALGANLGTASNPVLEGRAHDPASKRLPMGNLLNRALGVLAVLAAYPFVTPLVTSVEANPARAIADFHSGFNVTLALIFFPFLSLYARLLERLLPARPIPSAMGAPLFLERVGGGAPVTIALGGATREALRLSEVLEEMIAGLRSALVQPDRRKIEAARELDDRLDHINRAIKENLLAIDPTGLDATANDTLARILTFSINLEQAGDLIDRGLLGIARRRIKRGVAFSDAGIADLVAQVDRLLRTLRTSTAVFLSGDIEAARALTSEKEAFRRLDEDATAAHFDRLRSGNVETVETSALHLDALRDLKRVNSHLIEASAYPILKRRGDLLPSRLKSVE